MKYLTFAAAASSLAGLAAAGTCDDNKICLKTFRWCTPGSDEPCSYPDDVTRISAPGTDAVGSAFVKADEEYTLEWDYIYPGDLRDVEIRWSLLTRDTYLEDVENQFSWSKNTTGNKFEFRPQDLLEEMADKYDGNVTLGELSWLAATHYNSFTLASWNDEGTLVNHEQTSSFLLELGGASRAAKTAWEMGRDKEAGVWKKGVGIGVGVGVPVLMALTAVCTWFFAKKRMSKRHAGFEKHAAHGRNSASSDGL